MYWSAFTCNAFLQVNMHGDITFGQPWSSPFPQPFPQPVPMIAPFWTDFDLECENGDVFYRLTTSNSIRAKVVSDIQSHLSLQNSFDPTLVVIATWNETNFHGANYDSICDIQVNVVKELTEMEDLNSVYCYVYAWHCLVSTDICNALYSIYTRKLVQIEIINCVFLARQIHLKHINYYIENTCYSSVALLLCFTKLIQHLY